MPSTSRLSQRPRILRMPASLPVSALVESAPRLTTMRGRASSRWRRRNGRHICTSLSEGGRLPGGRHGIRFVIRSWVRSSPMLASMRSRNWPVGPAKGLPAKSSSDPGASPTSTKPACGLPSENTRFVAVAASGQSVKAATAARNSSRDEAACATAWARATGPKRGGTETCATGAATAGVARRAAGRVRSIGDASSASSAPHSICRRRAESASMVGSIAAPGQNRKPCA